METPIIFYGAGRVASGELADLVEKYNPVCFVDKDPDKHSSTLMGREIMPLEQALSKYPDALFYVTSRKYKSEIVRDLVESHVSIERIINQRPGALRLSCDRLETTISFGVRGNNQFCVTFCCGVRGHENYPEITIPDDIQYQNYDELAAFIRSERKKLISSINDDPSYICKGCPALRYGFIADVEAARVLTNVMAAPCNCKCFYCGNSASVLAQLHNDIRDKVDNFDFIALAEGLRSQGLVDDETVLSWVSGEFLLSKYKDKFLDYGRNHRIRILTNGLLYDERFAEWMSTTGGSGAINISLDSGTRETYRRIKGVDGFERVCENIGTYGKNRTKAFELKYIVCEGINDNNLDVDGFFEVAKLGNVSCVIIEREHSELKNPPKETVVDAAKRLYTHTINDGIPVFIGESFSSKEIALIKSVHTE